MDAKERGVHLAHCNRGEYIGMCKYGKEKHCPAFATIEAKDTVMNDGQIKKFMLKLYNNPILLIKLASALNNVFREEGKQEGIRGVVEYIEDKFGGAYEGLTEHLRHIYQLGSPNSKLSAL